MTTVRLLLRSWFCVAVALGTFSRAEEKNGLQVTVTKKTLDRADTRGNYYTYDRIDRTQGLKVTIKNTTFRPMPEGEIDWTIIVRRYSYPTPEGFTGTDKLPALKPAETIDLVIGFRSDHRLEGLVRSGQGQDGIPTRGPAWRQGDGPLEQHRRLRRARETDHLEESFQCAGAEWSSGHDPPEELRSSSSRALALSRSAIRAGPIATACVTGTSHASACSHASSSCPRRFLFRDSDKTAAGDACPRPQGALVLV